MLAVLALTLSPTIVRAQDWDDLVRQAAERNAIPAMWVRAVLRAESAGDPHAVSGAGAMGLMQLMPGTWKDVRRTLNLGGDPFDPHDNIVGRGSLSAMAARPLWRCRFSCRLQCRSRSL
jgi:soluble lytic murein transglycosylase-like protein